MNADPSRRRLRPQKKGDRKIDTRNFNNALRMIEDATGIEFDPNFFDVRHLGDAGKFITLLDVFASKEEEEQECEWFEVTHDADEVFDVAAGLGWDRQQGQFTWAGGSVNLPTSYATTPGVYFIYWKLCQLAAPYVFASTTVNETLPANVVILATITVVEPDPTNDPGVYDFSIYQNNCSAIPAPALTALFPFEPYCDDPGFTGAPTQFNVWPGIFQGAAPTIPATFPVPSAGVHSVVAKVDIEAQELDDASFAACDCFKFKSATIEIVPAGSNKLTGGADVQWKCGRKADPNATPPVPHESATDGTVYFELVKFEVTAPCAVKILSAYRSNFKLKCCDNSLDLWADGGSGGFYQAPIYC